MFDNPPEVLSGKGYGLADPSSIVQDSKVHSGGPCRLQALENSLIQHACSSGGRPNLAFESNLFNHDHLLGSSDFQAGKTTRLNLVILLTVASPLYRRTESGTMISQESVSLGGLSDEST